MRTIPAIVELEKGLVPMLIRRTDIQKDFMPTSRENKQIEKQIDSIRLEIIREVKKAIRTDELELETLAAKKKSLQKKITQVNFEAQQLKLREKELRDLERHIDLYSKNYLLYTEKTEDARIYSERKKRDLANVSIVSEASRPVKPIFPRKLLMLQISLLVGFFAAIATPFLLEFIDHRIKTPYEAEKLLSTPVICSIPDLKTP